MLKPTVNNLEQLNVGDVLRLSMGESVDGRNLFDSGAVVEQAVVDDDVIVDYVLLVQDATGRKGEEKGSKRRLLSEFEGFEVQTEQE